MESNQSTAAQQKKRPLLRRIWGLLPVLFIISLLVIVVVVLNGMIKSRGEMLKAKKTSEIGQDQPAINVVALSLSPTPMRESINLPGVIRPWISLRVVAEVRGKIVVKNVRQGQTVTKDHILAKIDERDYQNAYISAKAAYRAAKSTHDRLEALVKDRLATQSQLDAVVAQMQTSQAAMDNATLNLERCVIRSPMDGIVNSLPIEVGQFMSTGDPVADLLQVDRLKVEVGIPESDVDAVRQIKKFRVIVDALGSKTFEGKFHFLSKSTDSRAMLYRLEIALENPGGSLLPDMFARVEIVKKEVPDGLAVPLFALLDYSEQQSVFVVNDEHAHKRPVTIGIQDGWRIQVTEGLRSEEKVIVVGQRGLNDGDPVNVVKTITRIEELDQ